MKNVVACLFLALFAPAANAWIWQNLNRDSSGPLAGEIVHERDLLGKVVLIYGFSAKDCDLSRITRAQKLLESNDKAKFAVIGASLDETCDADFLRKRKITFPVYERGRVPHFHNKPANTMYVLDEYGRMIWQSRDAGSLRDLEKALAAAIAQIGQTPSLTAGASFNYHKSLKDQLVYGKELSQIEKSLAAEVAAGRTVSATAEMRAKAAEAQQILNAIYRGMEEMIPNVRTLMDINVKRAYQFLDLHLKSFPRDKEKYAKLYEELAQRAARER